MSEIVNAARFVDVLETVTDPLMREATRALLADEVMHGQFGFYYLESWSEWLKAHPAIRDSIGRYLRHAFAVLEREMAGPPPPHPALSDPETALGPPDIGRLRAVFYETVEHAIVPGIARFDINAARAWRTRSLTALPTAPARP